MTERLYYNDPRLTDFEARVIDVTERVSGWATVTLDRTAFYPTGGGQPSDTGTLDDAQVVECIDDEEVGVLHVIQGRTPRVGSTVHGHVDWERRFDHIQQHTGQHVLSQAFVELFIAETKGFRMMEQSSEIDVALDNPTSDRIERAVAMANRIIWEDRPVKVLQVTADEAAKLPLRKETTRAGDVRLIEIEGFDLTPCGGTHALRTGEIGMIAIRSWERAKGMTRIEFVAGNRAHADYARANQTARDVAAHFSVARDDAVHSVARLIDENKNLNRRVRALEDIAARVEAADLIGAARVREDGVRVITHIAENKDAESLKKLALALISESKVIALVASRDPDESVRLVFARSDDAAGDMNALMRDVCKSLDGRGGGRPELAQGGGHNGAKLDEVISAIARGLSRN